MNEAEEPASSRLRWLIVGASVAVPFTVLATVLGTVGSQVVINGSNLNRQVIDIDVGEPETPGQIVDRVLGVEPKRDAKLDEWIRNSLKETNSEGDRALTNPP
jgi:hypothetical protein